MHDAPLRPREILEGRSLFLLGGTGFLGKVCLAMLLDRFPKGDEVGDKLVQSFNQSLQEDGDDASYEDDIEPWLGERAAFFATSFETGKVTADDDSATDLSDGALVAETTDEDTANDKIRELAEQDGPVEDKEYKGVTYLSGPNEDDPTELSAGAVFDGVAVLGSEQGVKDAIDASQGDNLSSQTQYAEFRDGYGSDLFASVYVDAKGLLDAIPPSPDFGPQERAAVEKLYGAYLEQPIFAALETTEDQATFDFSVAASDMVNTDPSPLIDAGFEDSWAALAVSDIGEAFGSSFDQFSVLPEQRLNQVNAQLQRQLGFNFEDLRGIGDAAFFAAGTSIVSLQIGGVIQIEDAQLRNSLLRAMRRGRSTAPAAAAFMSPFAAISSRR